MTDPENDNLEMIEDMRNRVEVEGNAFGARKLVEYFYSPRTRGGNPAMDRWKEDWVLCSFAEKYSMHHAPALVWARRNPQGTNRADFSVYGKDRSFLCDIEVTGVWSRPTVKDPQGYEDFCPYPTWIDPSDPDVRHIDIDSPRKIPPYGTLKRVIETHLRDRYPPYWLVVWDNEHGVRHPNLDDLALLQRNRGVICRTFSSMFGCSMKMIPRRGRFSDGRNRAVAR